MTEIIGLVIGILVAAFGLYYYQKEKHSAESRKIYGTAVLLGAVVAVACIVMMALA